MAARRLDDRMVALALVAVAGLCVAFRYLPEVDLPQHYAMVSILVHHADPRFGFSQRYTFDFLGRPYATVYWLGAGLTRLFGLGAAMRVVVALCTVAPLAGAWALLAAARRPRVWLLAAVPFAFGSLWSWGFLNFLLGTGLMLAGLALVIVAARRPSTTLDVALGGGALLLLLTHFHGLAMLLLCAPLVAWAFSDDRRVRALARTLLPLVPAGLAGAAFVLITWSHAEGGWAQLDPGFIERVRRFPEFLAGGLWPSPWPLAWLAIFAGAAVVGFALMRRSGGEPLGRRAQVAFALALAGQVILYFALPLNTPTATYVSARHALLCILMALPLLPELHGWRHRVLEALAGAIALSALIVAGRHLACFDAEARAFDPVLAAMPQDRRILPLMLERGGACTGERAFPYLHFAAYGQAAHGGDLSHSFATVWNVPIRYRDDYRPPPIREAVEWAPQTVTPEELSHFDTVLIRSSRVRAIPWAPWLRERARSGPFTLLDNPNAQP